MSEKYQLNYSGEQINAALEDVISGTLASVKDNASAIGIYDDNIEWVHDSGGGYITWNTAKDFDYLIVSVYVDMGTPNKSVVIFPVRDSSDQWDARDTYFQSQWSAVIPAYNNIYSLYACRNNYAGSPGNTLYFKTDAGTGNVHLEDVRGIRSMEDIL